MKARRKLLAAAVGAAIAVMPLVGAAQDPSAAPGAQSLPPLDFGDEDIRDIRGPLPVEAPWWEGLAPWAAAAACALVLGLGGYALVKRLRRGPSARKLAMRRLDAARGELERGDPRRFADLASQAVRGYVEQRWGVHAPKRTTEELLADLASDTGSPLSPHRGLLADFLAVCDVAKFAGFALAREQMEAMDSSARRFVAAGATRGAA